jgi:hypothetical protein
MAQWCAMMPHQCNKHMTNPRMPGSGVGAGHHLAILIA